MNSINDYLDANPQIRRSTVWFMTPYTILRAMTGSEGQVRFILSEHLLSAACRLRWFLHRKLHRRKGWTHWHEDTILVHNEKVRHRICDYCGDVLEDHD